MISILIVDDDSEKIKNVCEIINEFPDHLVAVDYELEVKKALHRLQEKQYDLLILDIKLPKQIGSTTIDDGGVYLLQNINDTNCVKKPLHIIGFTSYDDSMGNHTKMFIANTWALIKYNKQSNEWKDQIRNKLRYILLWKEQFINLGQTIEKPMYDFAVITAVEREYRSVLDLDDLEWRDIPVENDSTLYKEATFKGQKRDYKIVIARQHQMGMPAAATLSMKLVSNFRPKYLCMLGIAAGKRGKVNLGDILVACESWDYGSGKITDDGTNLLLEPEPHQIAIDPGLKEIFLQDYSEALFKIRQKWNKTGKEITKDISLRVGPVASGAAVIQDESVVSRLIDPHNRKLIGLDMETYGVYYAALNCPSPKPKYFSIKSVCDFADKKKNDDYQSYASFVSANFFHYLLSHSIIE